MDDSQINYLIEVLNRVRNVELKKIDGEKIFMAIQLCLNDGIKNMGSYVTDTWDLFEFLDLRVVSPQQFHRFQG